MNYLNKEFLQPRKESAFEENGEVYSKKRPSRVVMDQPELSLGQSVSAFAETGNSSSSESDANLCRKRKHSTWDKPMSARTSVELQLNDPLPMDWEQRLDLQSGRTYYLNRKTLKKSWARPKENKIDLGLNISTLPSSEGKHASYNAAAAAAAAAQGQYPNKYTNSSGSMVAVACTNCHLLVMLSKSSPSCPNCKYVHSLLQKIEPVKSLETLSLLH